MSAEIPAEAQRELAQLEAEASGASTTESPAAGERGPRTKELLKPVVVMLAATAAPNWRLQEAECEMLAEAYAAIVDKYFPGGISTWRPELNAIIITAAVLGPRIASRTPARLPVKPDAAEQEAPTKGDARISSDEASAFTDMPG